MAKVLYYSVHEPLEFDDIHLFQRLGHTVFPLGAYFPPRPAPNPFRPPIRFGGELEELMRRFEETGCRFEFGARSECKLAREFIEEFDLIVVIHDIFFLLRNWDTLRGRTVVWRTIGQAIEDLDRIAEPLRRDGLKIVRWSTRERLLPGYIGEDAIIRAYKDPALYGPWEGWNSTSVLTFSSAFRQRYPIEYEFFAAGANGLDYVIGGGSNPDIPGAIGFLDFAAQRELLRKSRCYLYLHGSAIPYTLNFIEAWMSGIPVVALRRDADIGLNLTYNEVNDLVVDGESGFLVRDVAHCAEVLRALTSPHIDTGAVSRRARDCAIEVFGLETIARQWEDFLGGVGIARSAKLVGFCPSRSDHESLRVDSESRAAVARSAPLAEPTYANAVRHLNWYQCFDFGNGLYSIGEREAQVYKGKADAVFRHGVAGKTVIDIGAWDGYFSFEAERRGAARVLATDHFCWSGPGVGTKDGFDLAKSIFNSRIDELDIDVPDITPARLGMFDVVLFLGVLYHVRDPLGYLETIYSITREHAVIETALDLEHLDRPAISYVRGAAMPRTDAPLSGDPTNFFGPNSKAVIAMLETVGFRRIEWELWPAAEIPRGIFWAFR